MKKPYSMPEIMFENFAMSTNIAAGCEKHVYTYAKDSCGIAGSKPGEALFVAGVTGCTVPVLYDDYDGFCYHNPSEANNLFNS